MAQLIRKVGCISSPSRRSSTIKVASSLSAIDRVVEVNRADREPLGIDDERPGVQGCGLPLIRADPGYEQRLVPPSSRAAHNVYVLAQASRQDSHVHFTACSGGEQVDKVGIGRPAPRAGSAPSPGALACAEHGCPY